MIQLCGRFRLGVEALDVFFACELPRQDHLQCDDTIQVGLPGLEYNAHSSAGDLLEQLIVAEVANAFPDHRLSRGGLPVRCRQRGFVEFASLWRQCLVFDGEVSRCNGGLLVVRFFARGFVVCRMGR